MPTQEHNKMDTPVQIDPAKIEPVDDSALDAKFANLMAPADPPVPAEPPAIPPDSVAAMTGGDPDAAINLLDNVGVERQLMVVAGNEGEATIKLIQRGQLEFRSTKERITVADAFAGTDKAHIRNQAPPPEPPPPPPLSAATLREMAAGRAALEARRAQDALRPPPEKDPNENSTQVFRPNDFREYMPPKSPAQNKQVR